MHMYVNHLLSAHSDRLASLFGVSLDPLTSARPDVLARLCAEYTGAAASSNKVQRFGWRLTRDVHHVDGSLVPAGLLRPLRCVQASHIHARVCQRPVNHGEYRARPLTTTLAAHICAVSEALEKTKFPERRQRSGLQASGYFVLAPPGAFSADKADASVLELNKEAPNDPQQRNGKNSLDIQHNKQNTYSSKRKLTTAEKKIARQQATHGELWRAAVAVLSAADPVYARQPFHIAVTKNFSGSPHIGPVQSRFAPWIPKRVSLS